MTCIKPKTSLSVTDDISYLYTATKLLPLTCKRLGRSLQLLIVCVEVKYQIHDQQRQHKLQQPQATKSESVSNFHQPGEKIHH